MPTYKVTDPSTGRTFRLTGDSPPTEQELEEVFKVVSPAKRETSAAAPSKFTYLNEPAKPDFSELGRRDGLGETAAAEPAKPEPARKRHLVDFAAQVSGMVIGAGVVLGVLFVRKRMRLRHQRLGDRPATVSPAAFSSASLGVRRLALVLFILGMIPVVAIVALTYTDDRDFSLRIAAVGVVASGSLALLVRVADWVIRGFKVKP